jgi:protein involved in polysaccharide export with SLBB domain
MRAIFAGILFVATIAPGQVLQPDQTATDNQSETTPSGSPVGQQDDGYSAPNRADSTFAQQPTTGSVRPTTIDGSAQQRVLTSDDFDNDLTGSRNRNAQLPNLSSMRMAPPAKPSEFEDYVARVLGRRLPRFGTNLLVPSTRDFATPATATVPPDYILNVGDVVAISLTGSIEGSVEREIDTDGKIFLPKVGAVNLAGTRYADLRGRIASAIGRQYRGYDVTVGIKRLRGIRVYVTGFANNPGAFTVNSLSTMANAVLAAGGPSSGGSFRSVKLYRHGAEVADFDLYELVRGGSRVNDAILQNEDVLFIPPAGPQVAVFGSVNEEAIYEAKSGESVESLVAYAGGPNTLGDPSRVILYRANPQRDRVGAIQVSRQEAATTPAEGGDLIQLLSQGSLVQPVVGQSVLVRVEGEVNKPGNYYVAPNTPMDQVLALAGGVTPRAFAYGTKLQRVSVRQQQRESFKEAIKQLELTLAAAPLTADTSIGAADRQSQIAGAREVLNRLREAEPDGRVVLNISPSATSLPTDVILENNDQIYVPVRASTVGVFGAVYRPASFIIDYRHPMRVRDYIDRAGGWLRAADTAGIFVVRANGEVLSRRRGAMSAYVYPGDVIFVPVKTQSNMFWTKLREISTTLFQAGLSAATIGAL